MPREGIEGQEKSPTCRATVVHPTGSFCCPWGTRGMKPWLGQREKTLRWKGWTSWSGRSQRENLRRALRQVRRNRGAPGVDGMTVDGLVTHLKANWPAIRASLEDGTYEPQPVRRVEIPKAGGGTRNLGVPVVLDRFVEQALLQVLQAEWDPTFSEASFGFRPGRSAHQAVARAQEYIREGYAWVADLDLEKFFDRVNHDVLLSRVRARVRDRRVVRLIHRFLKAGVFTLEGVTEPTVEGTPQGGPLTPRTQKVTFSLSACLRDGVSNRCLICVVSRTMCMSHGSSDEGAQGPTAKCRLSAPCSADRGRRCGTAARGRVWVIAAAGIPLSRASRSLERACSRRGTDSVHHIQTPGEHGARAPRIRAEQWVHTWANRHTGAHGVFRRLSSATWLSGTRVTAPFTFSLITHSIDYGPASWPTLTRFWFRPVPARSRPL